MIGSYLVTNLIDSKLTTCLKSVAHKLAIDMQFVILKTIILEFTSQNKKKAIFRLRPPL